MGVYKKGRHGYIDYYVKGVRKRKKIGPSKQVAEQALAQVEVKIAKGEYLGIYEEKKRTLRQFAPEYLAYSTANKSPTSYARDQVTLERHLIPPFGDRYLFQISAADIEQYKQERLKRVVASTVNKELNCLRALLNKAVAWGSLQTNPLAKVKGLKEPPGRLRYLTPEEQERLLDVCASPPYIRPIVVLAIHTGMRRGELLSLCWADVDLRRRHISLAQTKNNDRRVIPLNETVVGVLRGLPRHLATDQLFPGTNGPMVTRTFWRACRKAAIPNLRFHDLRHTFASYLTMGGYNLRTVQQLLDHRDLRMTSRYAHLSVEHLQQAVKSLDTVFGASINPNNAQQEF